MTDLGETFGELRKLYPNDIARIEAEEAAVSALLKAQEYAALPETQKLVALCRTDIVAARLKLATDRTLSDEARRELWAIVDARSWFLRMVSHDYDSEITAIASQLRAEIERGAATNG